MFGLDFSKNTFLGIDVGTSLLKIVELKMSGRKPHLVNYAWMPLPDLAGRSDLQPSYFETTLLLCVKKMIKEAGFKSRNAYVSIPAFNGLITLIDFPEMPPEEMEQAIKFEAHKYIPTSMDEVAFNWDIVGRINDNVEGENPPDQNISEAVIGSASGKKVQVLLVAASRGKVEKYEKLVKSAGLKLRAIEIESFSMVSSLVGNDPGRFIIVDIGSRVCNIIIVEKGMIKATRNIDAGGKSLTTSIAKSMGVDEDKAERIKLSEKNFFDKESKIGFSTLEYIVSEVSRMIHAYFRNQGEIKLDGIILSGGTANLTGITEYFSQALNTKTVVGDPLARIEYDRKLDPALGKIKTHLTVSIGLALKGVDNYLKNK